MSCSIHYNVCKTNSSSESSSLDDEEEIKPKKVFILLKHPPECSSIAPAENLISPASTKKILVQVPVEPHVATCTNINSEVVSVGFLVGYAQMLGVEVLEDSLSHPPSFPDIFYDDVVLLSSWDPDNAKHLIRILRCFYLASSLKINLQKNKLIGVGVSYNLVEFVASRLGCASKYLPFVHLGVHVGQNMARTSAWSIIEDRFRSRLSGWKAKSLSFGGRLTLIKSVLGSLGSYLMFVFMVPICILNSLEALRSRIFWGANLEDTRMHLVRWDRVLADKKEGGLRIGRLFSFYRSLLFCWQWTFFHNPDLILVRVVKALHGADGGCSSLSLRRGWTGPWSGIIRMLVQLRDRGIDLHSFFPISVGDGIKTSFSHNVWKGDQPQAVTFPRIFVLDVNRLVSVRDKVLVGRSTDSLRQIALET
ncbi:hypothetical protein Lser_V15G24065 [Lactuca serriola]